MKESFKWREVKSKQLDILRAENVISEISVDIFRWNQYVIKGGIIYSRSSKKKDSKNAN